MKARRATSVGGIAGNNENENIISIIILILIIVDYPAQVILFRIPKKSGESARKRDNESERSDLGGRHCWE